jgi:hypothetical protein
VSADAVSVVGYFFSLPIVAKTARKECGGQILLMPWGGKLPWVW